MPISSVSRPSPKAGVSRALLRWHRRVGLLGFGGLGGLVAAQVGGFALDPRSVDLGPAARSLVGARARLSTGAVERVQGHRQRLDSLRHRAHRVRLEPARFLGGGCLGLGPRERGARHVGGLFGGRGPRSLLRARCEHFPVAGRGYRRVRQQRHHGGGSGCKAQGGRVGPVFGGHQSARAFDDLPLTTPRRLGGY